MVRIPHDFIKIVKIVGIRNAFLSEITINYCYAYVKFDLNEEVMKRLYVLIDWIFKDKIFNYICLVTLISRKVKLIWD